MKIALAGNPNSGKTTMYNVLTGQSETVGNWAGVTVEKKEHTIKKSFYGKEELIAVDLPGAYSMSPFTSEESVTFDYVSNESPDVIINIVDSTNLRRSLFFTTQLLELGIPMVVALNKSDINTKRKTVINTELLSKLLGVPVVETVSVSSSGLSDVVSLAIGQKGTAHTPPYTASPLYFKNEAEAKKDDQRRFAFVNSIVDRVEKRSITSGELTFSDKVDRVLTNRYFGIPIFAAVMFLVFWLSQSGPSVYVADLITGWMSSGQELLRESLGSESIWSSMLVDGIIGGFIAIVGFLPLIMVMYFLIALLEDCGYMARATVVLDPIFKGVGLSGKSVIPFIIGTGCAVPGVMASRTVKDERERKATAMLAPFMPCGAKLPLISLFAGTFFGKSAWVGAAMYFVGIAVIFLAALLINGITGHRKRSYFIIELPDYKLPDLLRASKSMLQRGWSYIVKAGTVILVCNFVIHVMQNFTWSFSVVEEGMADRSILASVAAPFAYVIAPIVGAVAWQLAAATLTGFIAKENVVGTLAVCYSISNLFDLENLSVIEGGESAVAATFGISGAAAMAFLVLNLFSPPCFAAIGAMNAELKSKRWLLMAVLLQLSVGYSLGFLVNFFGTLFTGGSFGSVWMPIVGWCVLIAIALVITLLIIKKNKELKAEVKRI